MMTGAMAISWDAPINDGEEQHSELLAEGKYRFRVAEFTRAYYNGSDKLPPCPMAEMRIELDGGRSWCKHNIKLYSNPEARYDGQREAAAFFRSIGARKSGEEYRMDWDHVVGATGMAQVGIREYVNKKGEKVKINEIKYWLDPPAGGMAQTTPQQPKAEPLAEDDIPF